MVFVSKSLCVILKQYKKIIIYGTGYYAQEIYPHLVNWGLSEKILCFTQTEDDGRSSMNGTQIIPFKAIDCDKSECAVLIATSKLYVDEIKQIVSEFEYPNVISLVDYEIDYRCPEKVFCSLTTFDEYCDSIADWYVETHIGEISKEAVYEKLLQRGKEADTEIDLNLIVMVCGHESIRSNKIIKAIIDEGYRIVMLNYCLRNDLWCRNDLQRLDILIHRCDCIEEMLYWALQYRPLVYYFEPRWGDCLWAEIMLKNKQYFGKIVFSLYDVINGGFIVRDKSWYATEKYALEHADGIVWRWFSKEYLENRGFQYQGKSIQFLDYCSHMEMELLQVEENSSIVKLCEVGGTGDDYVVERSDTKYTDFANIGEILEKIGNREDCIFHFYAGSLNKENLEKCKYYETQYKNFKFFLNTDHEELLRRLQYYDFGCSLYTEGEMPSDNTAVRQFFGGSFQTYVRNTFFDYLEAGLPIIATIPLKCLEYLQQFDVVIRMDLNKLDIDYLKERKYFYKKNAREAKEKLNIKYEIPRLINFLKNL